MPYVDSKPYVYSFHKIFQVLRLFTALRLFQTLEYLSIFKDNFQQVRAQRMNIYYINKANNIPKKITPANGTHTFTLLKRFTVLKVWTFWEV